MSILFQVPLNAGPSGRRASYGKVCVCKRIHQAVFRQETPARDGFACDAGVLRTVKYRFSSSISSATPALIKRKYGNPSHRDFLRPGASRVACRRLWPHSGRTAPSRRKGLIAFRLPSAQKWQGIARSAALHFGTHPPDSLHHSSYGYGSSLCSVFLCFLNFPKY